MLKTIGAICAAFFIGVAAFVAIALGTLVSVAFTILFGILYAVAGYLMGIVFVYFFPASVAAIVAWSGVTLQVPLVFALVNLICFFIEKSVGANSSKETITRIFNKNKSVKL